MRGFLSSSAGAIYVWKDFTQSSGTLTISNASAETGGVVDFGRCLRWLQVVLVPRFHRSCLMDSQRLHRCMSKLVFKFLSVPKSLTCFQSQRALINSLKIRSCYERTLHLGRRCHLHREGKLHPVGWHVDDHRRIGRVRWRCGENSGLKR